jgi:hypothetical protein
MGCGSAFSTHSDDVIVDFAQQSIVPGHGQIPVDAFARSAGGLRARLAAQAVRLRYRPGSNCGGGARMAIVQKDRKLRSQPFPLRGYGLLEQVALNVMG